MPASFIVAPESIDPSAILEDREAIAKWLPHRFEVAQLDAIHRFDPGAKTAAASRLVRADEWWVPGHIPGRPLLPGILMIEAAAQLCVWVYRHLTREDRFLGFAGADTVRFRGTVVPGQLLLLVARLDTLKSRQAIFATQGICAGKLVFEATVIGMAV